MQDKKPVPLTQVYNTPHPPISIPLERPYYQGPVVEYADELGDSQQSPHSHPRHGCNHTTVPDSQHKEAEHFGNAFESNHDDLEPRFFKSKYRKDSKTNNFFQAQNYTG